MSPNSKCIKLLCGQCYLEIKITLAYLGKKKVEENYKVILFKVRAFTEVFTTLLSFFFVDHHHVMFPRRIRHSNVGRISADNAQLPTQTSYGKFSLVYLVVILQCICNCHAVTYRMCKPGICTTISKQ